MTISNLMLITKAIDNSRNFLIRPNYWGITEMPGITKNLGQKIFPVFSKKYISQGTTGTIACNHLKTAL